LKLILLLTPGIAQKSTKSARLKLFVDALLSLQINGFTQSFIEKLVDPAKLFLSELVHFAFILKLPCKVIFM